MKRTLFFARRNSLEILRDPMSLFFGICFPIILLLLLSLIDSAIPSEAGMTLYHIENLAPGIAAFGLCFLALFASMLVSKDRCSSFMLRLLTSPMTAGEFISGYCLPMIPMGLAQVLMCYLAALPLGLPATIHLLPAIFGMLPVIILYISLGLLLGTILSEKSVGGICGALLTNLAGWLSGTWFSIEMIGGTFETICTILPFYAASLASKLLFQGEFSQALPQLGRVTAWAAAAFLAAVLVFTRNIRKDN